MQRRAVKSNNVSVVAKVVNRTNYFKEKATDDLIFKHDRRGKIGELARNNSSTMTTHVFHNVKRNVFYTTSHDGVKSPIQYRCELSNENKGVYIINRHIIQNISNADISGLTDYYRSGISDMTDEAINDIISILNEGSREGLNNVIRNITFIPYTDLCDSISIFDANSRLLISYNKVDDDYPIESDYCENTSDKNITVVINDSCNPGKIYYSNAFGVVRPIIAGSSLKGDYCEISYHVSGKLRRVKLPLDRINELGIYVTRELAISHGDMGAYLELTKFQHAMSVMDADSKMKILELKTKLELSNLSIEDKKLSLHLLDEKIRLETIKSDSIIHKSRADSSANNVKSIGLLGDIVRGAGKLVSSLG